MNIELMALTPGTKPNLSKLEVVEVPPKVVVTVMSTRPGVSAGETAVREVALMTLKLVALVAPNLTAVAPVNPVPVIVAVVPPAAPPLGDLPAEPVRRRKQL